MAQLDLTKIEKKYAGNTGGTNMAQQVRILLEGGEGEIVEVFQKGFKRGDKVIRYAMVKTAN